MYAIVVHLYDGITAVAGPIRPADCAWAFDRVVAHAEPRALVQLLDDNRVISEKIVPVHSPLFE